MKKIIGIIGLLVVMLLTGCGGSPEKELKSNLWNVVSTNGEAYTAEFANDTVTFKQGEFQTVGMKYEVNDNEISLIDDETKEHIFIIDKDGNEYIFTSKTNDVKDIFGDLTFSPKK